MRRPLDLLPYITLILNVFLVLILLSACPTFQDPPIYKAIERHWERAGRKD